MRHWILLIAASVLLVAAVLLCGCSMGTSTHDAGYLAVHHMMAGDSLVAAGDLRMATVEYSVVAQLYSRTGSYSEAMRKLTLLLLDPANPAGSDSAGAYWLDAYMASPAAGDHNEEFHVLRALLGKVTELRASLARAEIVTDSLSGVVRHAGSIAGGQNQRLQELEAELRQAKQELARLKEIDVRLSKTRKR